VSGAADTDVVIIGAGAVGLACAYHLARSGLSVIVVEAANSIGGGVSSRNSEVVHAGLHYPPGSLKARLCVDGRRALYPFLDAHAVAYNRCGKFIVATNDSEIDALQSLAQRAIANEVEGVLWVDGAEARAAEPGLACVAALSSCESGVFDSHGYMAALQGEVEANGGAVALASPFLDACPIGPLLLVRVGGADPTTLMTRALVVAAGLRAQACAAAIEGFPTNHIPTLHYGKGSYFSLAVKAPFQRLIYPPPIPGALGTHYRRDLGGVARFGPDLEFVEREDYNVDPSRAAMFYDAVRRFWPALPDGALIPDYAGIRPKLHGAGEPQRDWIIDTDSLMGVAALFGIESPGLTSSLAIGGEVTKRLRRFLA
jgi:L-2-hydroxyglutarate oxidase LhgO